MILSVECYMVEGSKKIFKTEAEAKAHLQEREFYAAYQEAKLYGDGTGANSVPFTELVCWLNENKAQINAYLKTARHRKEPIK